MIRAFLVKEWRERIGLVVFCLAVLVLSASFVFFARDNRDLLEMIAGTYALIGLPVLALMIGTSAFSGEIRNGAWPYLFSRPVGKAKIWLLKLLSMAMLLLLIVAVHALLSLVFPSLKDALSSFRPVYAFSSGLNLWHWSWIAAVTLFIVGFSISAFSASSTSLFFIGLFFSGALVAVVTVFGRTLFIFFPFLSGISVFVILIPLGLLAAAGLTFARFDPFLPQKNLLRFVRFGSISILAALLAGTGGLAATGRLAGPDYSFGGFEAHEGNIYFASRRGISVYRSADDRLERIRETRGGFWDFSIGGGRIAYLRWPMADRDTDILRVVNLDGSGARELKFGREGEAESVARYLASCSISRDGRTVAVLENRLTGRASGPERLIWMNSDGSGCRSRILDFLPAGDQGGTGWLSLIGWSEDSRTIFFCQLPHYKTKLPATTWAFHLETQTAKILLRGSYPRISPDGRRFVFFRRPDLEGSEIGGSGRYALLDAGTLAMEDLPAPVEGVQVMHPVWSPEGDRLAAAYAHEGNLRLGIFSLAEKRWVAQGQIGPVDPARKTMDLYPQLDWVSYPDKTFNVMYGGLVGESSGRISVFDESLALEKTIDFPAGVRPENSFMRGAGGKALVQFNSLRTPSALWRVDLKTGDWKKLR